MTQLRNKTLRKVLKKLDDKIETYKDKNPWRDKRNWRTYEDELYNRILQAIYGYEIFINKAIEKLNFEDKNSIGRPPSLTLKQKCTLLLLKQLIGKSNREMALLTLVFSALTNVNVSYKTIERLYSDEKVSSVFNVLHKEILDYKFDNSQIDLCGDGTGYSLTISRHYASEAVKLKNKLKNVKGQHKKKCKKKKQTFVYSFQLFDLKSRKYISYGTSFKSEQQAYFKAIKMAEKLGITIQSIRLDKYYSKQMYVKYLSNKHKGIKFYLIPQKDATIKGCSSWKGMLKQFIYKTNEYFREYYKRNQSESAFSEDKRRFGWKIQQKRIDRINMAIFTKVIWHNLFWIGKKV